MTYFTWTFYVFKITGALLYSTYNKTVLARYLHAFHEKCKRCCKQLFVTKFVHTNVSRKMEHHQLVTITVCFT